MADVDDSYVPLVTLTEEVAVDTGEQNETELYKERAKLYRFSKELNIWNERGTGDARLLQVGRQPVRWPQPLSKCQCRPKLAIRSSDS